MAALPGIPPQGSAAGDTASCSVAGQVAAINAGTCVVTGLAAGKTVATVKLNNGETLSVPVTVVQGAGGAGVGAAGVRTGDGNVAGPGGVMSTDGIVTALTGLVCVGGPVGGVAYVLRTPADAISCMNFGNPLPCANDPGCGDFQLTIINCTCADPNGIPFTEITQCFRENPLKDNAPPGITQCQRLP